MKEYPWFLDTYDGYPNPVQRVDALKYFLMLHYGGVYIDMDNVRHSGWQLYLADFQIRAVSNLLTLSCTILLGLLTVDMVP